MPPTSADVREGPMPESAPREARAPVGVLWRLAIFTLASAVGVLGLRVAMSPLSALIESQTGVRLPAFILTLSGGMLIGHWWTFRVAEPTGWSLVGLDRGAFSLRRIAVGAALGAAAVGVPSALLLAIGWLRVEPAAAGNTLQAALLSLALLIPAALWEELLARGYVFALVRERWGARIAIVVTSLLFGVMHLENAGATAQSIALVTLAGIFLGTILVSQRSLYAAWAAHVAWNFVMAGVIHTTVSGIGMGTPNYRTVDAGPDWATGGAWGPEAGIFAGVGMVAAIYFLLRRRARGGAGDNG
jgi:membrane protease YdiL (CAAX protease family)